MEMHVCLFVALIRKYLIFICEIITKVKMLSLIKVKYLINFLYYIYEEIQRVLMEGSLHTVNN